MNTLWQNISSKVLNSGSKLYLLIGINVLVFLVIGVPAVIEQLFTSFGNSVILTYSNEYLLLPAYLPKLLTHFWTPFTYMFMNDGIFNIIFNMLWLYWLGQIFENFSGNARTLGIYLLGGISGAFLYILSYNIFPAYTHYHSALITSITGASASVMAIIVATGTLVPNYLIPLPFIGGIKLKWLVLFYVLFDFLGIIGPNSGQEIAHIGGALFGFFYIKRVQKGTDWVAVIGQLFTRRPGLSKLKVAARNNEKKSQSRPRQEDVDRILDKISTTGYESLSKEEKEILFRASKNES